MKHFFTIPARYLVFVILLGATGLSIAGCTDTASIDPGPQLASLSVSGTSLQPPFAAETTGYSVDLPANAVDVTVSATKSDSNAVLSGDVPNEGQATLKLDGPGTTKTVSMIVTAPNGTSRTYTVTVKRALPSSDDALSDLTVNPGSLDPDFASDILSYQVTVANNVDSVTISATKSDPNAVVAALGSVIAAAGIRTGQVSVPLRSRRTEVDITVTAQDVVNTRSYAITIIRSRR